MANANMTPAEQADFAWKHRDHFAAVKLHNLDMSIRRKRGDTTGTFRNAWEELAGEAA